MATPALSFLSYIFISIEQMAVEIEQPFGDDPNDLPQELYIMKLEKALLEHDGDPNVANEKGNTPIHLCKVPELMILLLENKGDPMARNKVRGPFLMFISLSRRPIKNFRLI